MRIAENQPVFAFRIFCGTLLDESAERCDAGARADHHNRLAAVFGQPEAVVAFHKHAHRAVLFQPVGKETRCAARPGAPFVFETHRADGQVHFVPTSACDEEIEYRRGASGRSRPANCSAVSFAGKRCSTSAIGVLCTKPCKTALSAAIRSSSSSSANGA